MEDIFLFIVYALIALAVLALLLWIAKRFVWIEFIFTFSSSLALMIYSFTSVGKNDGGTTGFIEGIFLFAYVIFTGADFAFDKESYWETRVDENFLGDGYTATTKLQEKSTFWGVLGSSLAAGAVIPFLIYFFCDGNDDLATSIMGWIGVVCFVFSLISIARFIWGYFSVKRRYYDE